MKLQKGKGWNKESDSSDPYKKKKNKKNKGDSNQPKKQKKLALMLPEENGRRFLNALQEISNT